MPDFDFSFFGRVPGNYGSRVQWYSTLFPLGRVVYTVAELQEETKHLIQMWRARAACLAEYGWEAIAGSRSLQNARNCCPAFAYTLPRTRCCNFAAICPFCHARQVREVWSMLEEAFHGETLGEPQWYYERDDLPKDVQDTPAVCRFKLVERTVKSEPFLYHNEDRDDPEDLIDRLGMLLKLAVTSRAKTMRALAPAAGFHNTTIEPDKKGWKVRHRQLLMFRQDADLSHALLQPAERRKVTVHEAPTRTTLYHAVARVCRYPTALMHGDPALVASLLAVKRQHKVRLTATFGRFRGLIQ